MTEIFNLAMNYIAVPFLLMAKLSIFGVTFLTLFVSLIFVSIIMGFLFRGAK